MENKTGCHFWVPLYIKYVLNFINYVSLKKNLSILFSAFIIFFPFFPFLNLYQATWLMSLVSVALVLRKVEKCFLSGSEKKQVLQNLVSKMNCLFLYLVEASVPYLEKPLLNLRISFYIVSSVFSIKWAFPDLIIRIMAGYQLSANIKVFIIAPTVLKTWILATAVTKDCKIIIQ